MRWTVGCSIAGERMAWCERGGSSVVVGMSIKGGFPGQAVGLVRSAQVVPGQLSRSARARPRTVRSVVLQREVLFCNTGFGLCLAGEAVQLLGGGAAALAGSALPVGG